MTQGRQSLAGDGASVWRSAFDAFVEREFSLRDTEDRRTNAQKRADAAVAMAHHALAALRGEKPTADVRPTVTVLVRYEDLIGEQIRDWAGEDAGSGQPLSGEAVRRLCCDAGIVRMVTAGDSQVLDAGRKTRTIPTATRRAVLARDGGCTFPGCRHRQLVEVHHVRHWAHLGPTDMANLMCGCWRHHRLLHEGGWHVHLDPESQRTIWTAPDGRQLIGQRRAPAGAQRTPAA